MNNKLEILAPVGSEESLYPACIMGADAVYLGGQEFSARKNAKNFSRDSLKNAVYYCHVRNIKVYLTVNTMLRDSELPKVMEFISYAASLPVDAFIVQDLGLALLIKSNFPSIKLHASTQMSIHTPAGAKYLYDFGFSRVVLSRELSKKEIIEIAASSPIELEVFVHGALCMGLSGQCYFSAMLGGRSGNRGRCAQPCRLPMLCNKSEYALSLKDLSIIPYLKELEEIGVKSAKIEGRMKRPEYVAAAVSACRKSLGDNSKIGYEDLRAVFSRSGFTDGYYNGKLGKDMFGVRSKEDVLLTSKDVLSSIRQLYKNEKQFIPLDFELNIVKNMPISLKVNDDEGNIVCIKGDIPEQAKELGISEARCRTQIAKTGGTPFFCRNIKCQIEEGLSFPISEINKLRRKAIDCISKNRAKRSVIEVSEIKIPKLEEHKTLPIPKVRVRMPSWNIPKTLKKCDLIYIPIHTPINKQKELIDSGYKIALEIPRCIFGKEKEILNMLQSAQIAGVTDVWAGNIGAIELAEEIGMNIHGGFGLNIANSQSICWAEQKGLKDIEISFELSLKQIGELQGNIPRGIIAYGRLPLMITRNIPGTNRVNETIKYGNHISLKDRKNIKFPVMHNFDYMEVLNSIPLYIGDKFSDVQNIDFTVLWYSVENSVEIEENFNVFNKQESMKTTITRGLYYKGVE